MIALAVGELTTETGWQRLLVYLAVTGAYLIGRLGADHQESTPA